VADWDVIAKQRLTEDWGTLRSAYLPLNQAMRRCVEFLEKGDGSFSDLLTLSRERLEGSLKNLTSLCNRRSPWVRLEAIRNLRVLGTGLKGAANDDPRALLRYLFALSELLRGRDVRLVWEVDALFAWTLDEFEDYLASERYALPTTPRVAAIEDLGATIIDVPSESLRRGNELFGGQGGGLFGPLDLKHLELR